MRPGEFWEALRAYREEKDADRRHLGELARGMAYMLVNIQLKKKDRITSVKKFWPMPWDEPAEQDSEVKRLNSLTDEERHQEALKFAKKIKL